ncbi:hypothetical protein SPRG_20737 [Saprolegnia parasitica CBS 223.65]|uniref:Uncharacterized protein n=1 Tax=Saprolegnia parasitica (strain CBS 223.65) TaxID=695850 RepID=A0A067C4C4_SAPPC|nr:hypothetical protein SPRG_20737 [Saprolegnia parasitica CBS 223.65]KDO25368.1 hypothetical protein SPRG_20737 [Saprolegnia parasitica CBS 223.65]|eukprot:XP_012204027.1 hypothetical protein SPRG_20737 [Saprolegnia parasitica CBS 223.65]
MAPTSLWHNSVVRLLLLGTLDEESSLHGLRGQTDILKAIVNHLHAIWRAQLKADQRGYVPLTHVIMPFDTPRETPIPNVPQLVTFPPPITHLVDGVEQPKPFLVNMMPFIIGHAESTLPPECQRYVPLLNRCRHHDENGKVGYLTIHEGIVEADTSQRRPGSTSKRHPLPSSKIRWGRGWMVHHELQGGIYMASTVAKSCGVWNTVVADENDIVGAHGDVDVLHGVLDRERDGYYEPQANELYWITDRTPHESLPVATTQFRQYFRFVTSNVSHWFAEHSTPNPLGIQPTATIVYGNKFTGTLTTETSA